MDVGEISARQKSVALGTQPTGIDEVSHDRIGLVNAKPALSEGHGSGQIRSRQRHARTKEDQKGPLDVLRVHGSALWALVHEPDGSRHPLERAVVTELPASKALAVVMRPFGGVIVLATSGQFRVV